MVKEVSIVEFDELIKGDKPVVCDFFATWCGPCKMLAPVIDNVSADFEDRALFVKVDVDKNIELAKRYNISSIPLVAVFEKGAIKEKSLGYMSASEFKELVDKNV